MRCFVHAASATRQKMNLGHSAHARPRETLVERRSAERFAVLVPGRYSFKEGAEHNCVTENVSSEGVALRGLLRPPIGTRVICDLRNIGRLSGRCARLTEAGFVLSIETASIPLNLLAYRLRQIADDQDASAALRRIADRVVPKQTGTLLTLGDGTSQEAEVINISQTGVALCVTARPDVNSVIVVGQIPARVIRHFESGIGAAFLTPLPAEQVTREIVL